MELKTVFIQLLILGAIILTGCRETPEYFHPEPIDPNATSQTRALLLNLDLIRQEHVLFGHQDTLAYGVHWRNAFPGRSDVKDVTGSYPAVYGWDVGNLERGRSTDLDKFNNMREWIREGYERGGVITISWHMNNPVTGGNAWDTEGHHNTVAVILPGGMYHEKFKEWLDLFAGYAKSLKAFPETENEHLIPVIFRPFHEHTGNWFWWGAEHCSPEEYKRLWQFTVQYLRDEKEVNNLLWALSPSRVDSVEEYLERYPGDDYVDILGLDDYRSFREPYALDTAIARITMVVRMAEDRGKIPAFTETGYEAIPDPDWWTDTLLAVLDHDPVTRRIAWVLVWRNANELSDRPGHYYVPYTDHPSAENFISFYNSPLILFEDDLPDMYK